jgi:hypothetical protein
MILPGNSICSNRLQNKKQPSFNHYPYKLFAAFIFIVMLGALLIAGSVPAQNQMQITGIEENNL